jgi:hypothetical protein
MVKRAGERVKGGAQHDTSGFMGGRTDTRTYQACSLSPRQTPLTTTAQGATLIQTSLLDHVQGWEGRP